MTQINRPVAWAIIDEYGVCGALVEGERPGNGAQNWEPLYRAPDSWAGESYRVGERDGAIVATLVILSIELVFGTLWLLGHHVL
jgi:hypothetical protein